MRWSKSWLVLLCVLTLVATACGSRLSDEKILAQNVVRDAGSGTGRGTGGTTAGNTADDTGGTAAGNTAGGAGDAAVTGAGGAASSGSVTGQGSRTGGADQAVATRRAKAPIVIGLIGWLSGLGGGELDPARDTWQAWQRSVNAKGGINGHPVKLLVGDDGGNTTVAVSIARDFVETKGAVALTSVDAAIGFADYAKSKGVPVIGTIPGTNDWLQNPMLFPPFPAPEAASWGAIRLIKKAGMTKAAFMYCVETADCASGKAKFVKYAHEEGVDVVYTGQYSVVQPDFTAECLQLQRSGAQAVFPVGDNNSMIRMAQTCSRQRFRPVWVSATEHDSLAKIPEFDRAIGVTGAFPWFMKTESPAIAEYADAIQKYAPGLLADGVSFQSWAWQSAKLFEKAAANVSDQPTRQDILHGLWSMRGETIDGLAPGGMARSFTQGQPAKESYCIFDVRIQNGTWAAPQGLTPVCR